MGDIEKIVLTDAEREFCELFVDGGAGFAGQAAACYTEAFGENRKKIPLAAKKVLMRPHIAEYIKELVDERTVETEAIAVKLQVSETLKAVMAETSKNEYVDKYGMSLSPAPLRAVSVNAAKALMDLYPIKHGQDASKKGDGNNGNITFNVIVPQIQPRHEDED